MRILVTGAGGFIGFETAVFLKGHGHCVSGLIRDSGKTKRLRDAGIDVLAGDILDAAAMDRVVSGFDILVHCAAFASDWGKKDLFLRTNFLGTKNVLESCVKNAVKRVLYVSTVDIFGHSTDGMIREDSPFGRQPGWYAHSKKRAEMLAREYMRSGSLDMTIIYPTWVYGEGDRHFVPEIIEAIKAGEMLFFRNRGNHTIEVCYIKNLVTAIHTLLFHPQSAGSGYIITDSPKITFREFVNTISAKIGCKPVTFSLPYWMSYCAAALMEAGYSLVRSRKRPLLTRHAVTLLGNDIRYDISKLQSTGFIQPYRFPSTIDATIAWYRETVV
jgi:nucleoside-diphosphate-sugar epimerase